MARAYCQSAFVQDQVVLEILNLNVIFLIFSSFQLNSVVAAHDRRHSEPRSSNRHLFGALSQKRKGLRQKPTSH